MYLPNRHSCVSFALVLLVAAALAGCGSKEEDAAGGSQAAASSGSSAATEEAVSIFGSRCATCHGAQGAGDGAASASLNPRPANFQEAAWQQSVTDEHIDRIIVQGGAAVGKSAAMPGNPDLQNKPEVVTALRQHIRSLAH